MFLYTKMAKLKIIPDKIANGCPDKCPCCKKKCLSNFATRNIIAAEEAFVEKAQGVEKLKSLSTGKSIQMARKFVDDSPIPFYGKIVLCTNNVKDFMRICAFKKKKLQKNL